MTDALATALDGVRVVALATNIPGPLAAARLRAMGASVTKFEPLDRRPARIRIAAMVCGDLRGPRRRSVQSARGEGARRRCTSASASADVLLTTMRGSALTRLGLSWDALHRIAPRLVHVAVTGEGAPHEDRAGSRPYVSSRARTYCRRRRCRERSSPTWLRPNASSPRCSQHSFCATRTGCGVRIDVAIVDAAMEFNAPLRYGLTGENDVLGGWLAAYNLYRASDGWIAVAALEAHFMDRLRAELQLETLDARRTARSVCAPHGGAVGSSSPPPPTCRSPRPQRSKSNHARKAKRCNFRDERFW